MEDSRDPRRRHAAALACLSLCTLLAALGTSVANIALPALARAFDAPFERVQWVVVGYLLAVTTLVVSAGRLGDAFGRKRLLLAGISLFTLASALCAAAPTLSWLIAARAAQGVGAAIMMALAMAFVGDTVAKAGVGRAMGLLGTMSAIGTALGPSLGGALIAAFGWPSIFLANLPLGLVALGLAHRHLPEDREPNGRATGFDIAGTALLALTLAAYALGVTGRRGVPGPLDAILLVAAAVGTWAFVRVEKRAASPLVSLATVRDPALAAGLLMSGLVSTVMMATLVVGPFYLSLALKLEAALVGLLMSVGPAVVALAGVPAGRVTDRLGARRVTVIGLSGMAAGCVALFAAPATLGVPGYVLPIVVVTLGYALFQTANNTAIMAGVDPRQRGVVSGMLNLSRNLGLISGASAMGAVFAAASRSGGRATADPAAVANGMQVTFAVGALLVALALWIALRGRGSAAAHRSLEACP